MTSNDNPNNRQGLLIVISGPSGVGKGTVCRELKNRGGGFVSSVSATTRSPRHNEIHGKDYFFYSKDEFEKLVKDDALLEWAEVYGNLYGTPKEFVEQTLRQGKDCILEIDVQGACQVKEKRPDGVFIFIVPPSKEELLKRITQRGTERPEEIIKRMSQADDELKQAKCYDYIVVNDRVEDTVEKIEQIIRAEKNKTAPGKCPGI